MPNAVSIITSVADKISIKSIFSDPELEPDPLFTEMDPQIRIKMKRIRNTDDNGNFSVCIDN